MTASSRKNIFRNREAWLTDATTHLMQCVFEPADYKVPDNIRVACSWPTRGGLAPKRRVVGHALHESGSADGHFEIVVTQNIDDSIEVLGVLAHELCHVVVGFNCGHRGAFKKCAEAIGLEGPMTSTRPGEAFKRSVEPLLEALGPYPHGRYGPELGDTGNPVSTGKRPQKARLIKAQCDVCGLTLRLTRKWIGHGRISCPDMDCTGHDRQLVIG